MKVNSKTYNSKIVIIDSGIDTKNNYLMHNVIGGLGFVYDKENKSVVKSDNYEDENGHGTSCAAIIKRMAQDIGMFIIKVLDKEAKTSSKVLIECLKYLVDIDIRVINLSVATVEESYREEFYEVCSFLCSKGKILICSCDNRNDRSLLAVLPSVIGVKGSDLGNPNYFWFNHEYEIQCVADILPVFILTINNVYRLFGGNSKATAEISGIIANILSENPSVTFNQLNEILESKAQRIAWTNADIVNKLDVFEEIGSYSKDYNKNELKLIEDIIIRSLNLNNEASSLLYSRKLYHPQIGIDNINCYKIVKDIENTFDIKLNYDLISLRTFNSIFSLLAFIQREKDNDQS